MATAKQTLLLSRYLEESGYVPTDVCLDNPLAGHETSIYVVFPDNGIAGEYEVEPLAIRRDGQIVYEYHPYSLV